MANNSFALNDSLVITLRHDENGNLMEIPTHNDESEPLSNEFQTDEARIYFLPESSHIGTRHVIKQHLISKFEGEIPSYLTIIDAFFEKLIANQRLTPMDFSHMAVLQQMVVLIHRTIVVSYEKSIWLAYLGCGLGTLRSDTTGNCPKYWPKMFQTSIESINVLTYLEELDSRNRQYLENILEISKCIPDYDQTIETSIRTFIQQQLHSLRIETENKITSIRHEYEYHRLQSVLIEEKLGSDQIRQIIRLCDYKYKFEETKKELMFLTCYMSRRKQLMTRTSILDTMLLSIHIKSLHKKSVRQQFFKQTTKMLSQCQNRMNKLALRLLKADMAKTHKLFNATVANLRQSQHGLPSCRQFNDTVINTIELLFANVTDRVECVYQRKIRQLCAASRRNQLK
ncbi:unnamed protein product [Adineta ricciae]|uniref:Uncharacterized protein n=1 Tax=Adineta ricciae TaxID=249248 RepID=A0A814ISS2_ADIRI|nr:unnamed protein product [Adineta ricciae]